MYFVLLAAALAILAGVVVVAMGRGGEIARSRRDLPIRPPRIRSARDVARLRLPIGLLGYQEQATDEALDAAARLIAEQEAEIARLREEVWRPRPERDQETLADPPDGAGPAEAASGQGAGGASPQGDGLRGASPGSASPRGASPRGASPGAASSKGASPTGAEDKVPSPDPVGGQP